MKILLTSISVLILLTGLLPLIKNDNWVFRVFDYPRVQKLIVCLVLLFCWGIYSGLDLQLWDLVITFLLVVMVGYLLVQIFPFTPLAKRMIQSTKMRDKSPDLNIMVINVYQYNPNFDKVVNLLKSENPDIFLLVETDQKWAAAIALFKETYPYHIEIPLDNTYGMLFYSKNEIVSNKINYLIDHQIPSLETLVKLGDGELVKIFSIHPMPPVPQENPESTERDAEILLVGKMVKAYQKPAIVIGDLNDVGWSYTSSLFLKTSGLLDPRRGRGMFSTFHSKYFFLRWPLDHIFVSKHFTLDRLTVHGPVGSDHFPISATFSLQRENNNQKMDSNPEAEHVAQEKIANGLAKSQD
jgi:endonuclease/exonuclease/phosphatase (EEP) superfamily protein YafD